MTNSPVLLRPHTAPVRMEQVPQLRGRHDDAAIELSGITLDSRLVVPGDLYVGLAGSKAHGARFAPAAVAAGARAVLTDPEGARLAEGLGVPVVAVPDPRAEMASVAATIYHHPAQRMTMYAVTGTNGKTTTATLLAAALAAAGQRVGVIGTLGFFLDGVRLEGARTTVTTPESPDLQALLAILAERGADAVAMEVSSHAMALRRADAITFDVAGFTNLGRDHLDFHQTIENYFEAKAALFAPGRTRAAVINVDDPWGDRLAARVAERAEPVLRRTAWQHEADYRIVGVGAGRVQAQTPGGAWDFALGLPGDFNVRNAVTALAMAELTGVDPHRAMDGLADVQVPGRMQRVALSPAGPEVFVDFAHTPQAIEAALGALAEPRAAGRRVIAVLGCGGDRDQTKREPMGEAAARGSDVLVVTDDNPRSEDPPAIRAALIAGARTAGQAEVVDGGERREAIRIALDLAGPDGLVALLGKGHEQGQEIAGRIEPFDDARVAAEEWAGLHRKSRPEQEGESLR